MLQCIVKHTPQGKPVFIQRILDSVNLLSEYFSVPPLQFAGMPPLQIELTITGLDEYITWFDRVDQFVPKPFILASHDYKPKLEVFVTRNPEFELLRFYFSSENQDVLQIDSLFNFLSKLWDSFDAFNIYTHDQNLSDFYNEYFLPIDKFDNYHVPRGVSWLNVWSCLQVETIGRDRVNNAPWAKAVELTDGGLILSAIKSLTDANEEHLTQLRNIAQHLDLRALQNNWLLPESSIYAIDY